MRAILLASAAVLATIATPAAARNGAWYVGGDFGGMIVEDIDFDIGTLDNAVKVRPDDLGFDGSLFVGYDLGTFRLEAEVALSTNRAMMSSGMPSITWLPVLNAFRIPARFLKMISISSSGRMSR